MLMDMHIHTSFSPCSIIRIRQLSEQIRLAGIDGVCITDHDTVASRSFLKDLSPYAYGLSIIIGLEYTTSQGDILIFGPVDDVPRGMDAESILAWVRNEGGVAIPAHPFRRSRPADPNILPLFDIIEVANGRNQLAENERCRSWIASKGHGKKCIGGSDAHTPDEIGCVVTVFGKNIYTPENLVRELRDGDYAVQQRRRDRANYLFSTF